MPTPRQTTWRDCPRGSQASQKASCRNAARDRSVGKNCHAQEDRCVREIGRLVSDLRDAQVRLQTFIELRDKASKKKRRQLFPHTEELLLLERESFSAAFAGWQRQAIPQLKKGESASGGLATGRPELETNLRRSVQNLQTRPTRTCQND